MTGYSHQNAAQKYLQEIGEDADIVLVNDIMDGAKEVVKDKVNSVLIQCSAHLNVHLVTERFLGKLHVNDTYIYPTQAMALLKRKDVDQPVSLGIPEPAMGYIDENDWGEIVFESTKPVVTANLLKGKYDAGFAYVRDAEDYPDQLEICDIIGEVVTTWIVYSKVKRFSGRVIRTR